MGLFYVLWHSCLTTQDGTSAAPLSYAHAFSQTLLSEIYERDLPCWSSTLHGGRPHAKTALHLHEGRPGQLEQARGARGRHHR
jgi:hypothetical protein